MTGEKSKLSSFFYSSGSLLKKNHKPECRRLVRKNGKSEILMIEPYDFVTNHDKRSDLVHSLIDAKWKWTLAVLVMTFIFTWLFFAILWMAIGETNETYGDPISSQCLIGISNFSGYLLFSIETQTSIGYGSRYMTQNCFDSIAVFGCQILVGMGLGGSIVSIVYAKMISPKTQHSDLCFTKNAVICQRDGELCLIFRARDTTRKYELQNSIKAFLIKMRNGEYLLRTLKLEPIGMIIWPTEMVHKITKTSPFWELSAKDLVSRKFEIVVVMEGTSLSTNQPSRTVTSYLSNEILWGNTFKSCVKYDKKKKSYKVSHKRFNATTEVYTPLCSAKQLCEIYTDIINHRSETNTTVETPDEGIQRTSSSVSPDSGIAVSPLFERPDDVHYESSEFSSSESFDEEEEKSLISRFQIRKRSVDIVTSLMESFQKYVVSDNVKNNKSSKKNPPMETAL